ncbi:MAG TPA: cupin domain-containing protein [Candidatus Methylacidiphilales bacterium]
MEEKRSSIPPDDVSRKLVIARPESDESLLHLGLAGDTYTILLTGKDTAGQFCLIDMLVPPGGGPGLHRHDFEETFILREGEIEFTFRKEKTLVRAGETINIPANAPHKLRNQSDQMVRMLCLCSPAGQDDFFLSVGVKIPLRTSAAPKLDEKGMAEFARKAQALAPRYRTELLKS